MTTKICGEDVVVRLSSPQITETILTPGNDEPDTGNNVVVGQTRGLGAVGIDLGRRLLLAARAGDTVTVLDLMAKGAPFTTDWLGTSPLHLAAANGHAETCGVLLRAGVSRDARTKVERTPLHVAAHAGHAAVVELLLQWGASPHARDLLRMTPLHWAAARGHAAAARVLLRAGAEPRARCKFRKTPRCHAARANHKALLALLDAAEADASAAVLTEQMAEETPKTSEPQLDTVWVQNTKQQPKLKLLTQKPSTEMKNEYVGIVGEPGGANVPGRAGVPGGAAVPGGAGVSGGAGGPGGAVGPGGVGAPSGEGSAAALLRQHGITLLPADDGSTVLNALQSGRTIVLSDAGKLMLKESNSLDVEGGGVGGAGGVATSTAGGVARPKGVVVRATPVRSPPHGVKVFALTNNKLLSLPKVGGQEAQQVKIVQMPTDAKIVAAPKVVAMKAKAKTARPAVKIILNKANFNKLVANAKAPLVQAQDNGKDQIGTSVAVSSGSSATETGVESVRVPEQFVRSSSAKYLRAQLLAAHVALANLEAELRACRARLAHYEATP